MVSVKVKEYFFGKWYQNAIPGGHPVIKVIAIVAEHYGPVERMRLHNAEAEREVWITRHRGFQSRPQELAAEGEFSKLTLIGADRQSPCMTYRHSNSFTAWN